MTAGAGRESHIERATLVKIARDTALKVRIPTMPPTHSDLIPPTIPS